jgi:2'-5' RNA ligase
MRTFLAVVPSEDTARDIHSSRAVLRQVWKGVRWVIPQHFHITLVFLGEREDEIVDEISGVVGPVIAGFPCFNIQFDGIGCFGSPSFPRLIYERIGDGADHLVALNRSLQAALENLIGKDSKRYHPHLTLGRSKRRGVEGPEGGELLPPGTKPDNVGAFRASEVVLYRSVLRPEGAQYTILNRWPLKEAL